MTCTERVLAAAKAVGFWPEAVSLYPTEADYLTEAVGKEYDRAARRGVHVSPEWRELCGSLAEYRNLGPTAESQLRGVLP